MNQDDVAECRSKEHHLLINLGTQTTTLVDTQGKKILLNFLCACLLICSETAESRYE